MAKYFAHLIAALALTGCASIGSLDSSVTLTTKSYDRLTGDYVLELKNDSSRPVLYLNPYRVFNTVRSGRSEPFPLNQVAPEGTVLLIHDTLLDPGESVEFRGKCTREGACSSPDTFVAVRACWSNSAFTCKRYWPIWSNVPINGT